MAEPEADDRRVPGADRRRYNKRATPEGSPPYYEVFERVAIALERIAAKLAPQDVRLPDTERRRAHASSLQ